MATEQNENNEVESNQSATTVKFMFAGIVFVINGFLADWILGTASNVGDFSAMIGARE